MDKQEYAGFWIRALASLIDTVLIVLILTPITIAIYGADKLLAEDANLVLWDILLNYLLPALIVIIFWVYKSATPGKIATKLIIVDAITGEKPSTGQFIGRYLAYFPSMILLFLGFIWVGIDKRKQGWHDKMAGTLVIKVNQAASYTADNQTE